MIDEAAQAACAEIGAFMERLAGALSVDFPAHAQALRGEIIGRRLTMDRWNRVAAVLASLHAVPGTWLLPMQHGVRNCALSAIVVAQKMAAAGFSWRDQKGFREMAKWRADEISRMMDNVTSTTSRKTQ